MSRSKQMNFHEAFHNKKILVTGHTGFKGSWLCLWLKALGADVFGLSNRQLDSPSNFEATAFASRLSEDIICDIRDLEILRDHVERIQPQFIFHLAAQPIVTEAYLNPIQTFSTNALGTLNILEALRGLEAVTCILITSDKVYENNEWIWGYRENDALGGKDPYSASKAMAEIGIRSFFQSFLYSRPKIKVAVARAGNVIGGGDWAPQRIVPDTIRAWSNNEPVKIRNLASTRPWQHVMEPLGGYLLLATKLAHGELGASLESFNFGPPATQNASVRDLIELMGQDWGMGYVVEQKAEAPKEAGLLRLNCDKAQALLGWSSLLALEDCAKMTVEWYRNFYQGEIKPVDFTLDQIAVYQEKLIQSLR